MNTSFHSFLFIIPAEFFSDAGQKVTPYEVNVRYALHWNKKVDVEAYYIKPGMAKHIVNWDKLEEQMQLAAENNSKQYRVLGDKWGRAASNDPHELLYAEQHQQIK